MPPPPIQPIQSNPPIQPSHPNPPIQIHSHGGFLDAVTVDFAAVMERMRKLRASIAPIDSVARYKKDFCEEIYLGHAKFLDAETIEVDGKKLKFDKGALGLAAVLGVPRPPRLVLLPPCFCGAVADQQLPTGHPQR